MFVKRYYDPCNDGETDDQQPDCNWTDTKSGDGSIVETIIKYTESDTDFAITITVFFSTGSINVQGKRRCLDIWLKEHYPSLHSQYLQPVDLECTSLNVDGAKKAEDKQKAAQVESTTTTQHQLSEPQEENNKTKQNILKTPTITDDELSEDFVSSDEEEDANNNTVVPSSRSPTSSIPSYLPTTPKSTSSPQQKIKMFLNNQMLQTNITKKLDTSPVVVNRKTPISKAELKTEIESTIILRVTSCMTSRVR